MVWDLRLHGEPGGPTSITGTARFVLATYSIAITLLSGRTGWPTRKLNHRLQHVQRRQYQPLRTLTEPERAELVRSLIGPAGPLTERKAFTRDGVIRVAAPHLYGCPEELDRVVIAIVRHPEAIPLVGQPGARGEHGPRHRH
ncbi:MAG TPA: hypothetical protein VK988_14355, partial [Acidimicrobiales bacterium]|nr:hypothetical protein [Acidimicrobiales bacterium]